MRRLVVLHSNDIHGRVDALARIATLVERARAEADDAAVLYVEAGDVEDTTERLSNLTKGVALHRLLRVAGCQAVAVGNGTVIRYGSSRSSSRLPQAATRTSRRTCSAGARSCRASNLGRCSTSTGCGSGSSV
jgi:hypothetical protein